MQQEKLWKQCSQWSLICTGREGDDSDSDNDCISITEAVRVLRDYVMTFDESGAREKKFLRSLSEMEDDSFESPSQETEAIKTG